jgi:hypothetical protein
LARRRNISYQLLKICGVSDVRQTDIHTSEPPVFEPSSFEVEMAIKKSQFIRY